MEIMLGYYYGIDITYLIFIVPCIIISLICSTRVNTTFKKYSAIPNSRGLTGAQAAHEVLTANGVVGVKIEHVRGNLTDHFDPSTNTIRLSDNVYNSTSVAAVGVASHEAGHAVQHAQEYLPNKIRGFLVPAANIGSKLSWILILIGFCFIRTTPFFLNLGILFFSLSVLFTLVTLPVEFNASKRALQTIQSTNMLSGDEFAGAKQTLSAAAMTYVAAALTAVLQLVRLILLSRNRD